MEIALILEGSYPYTTGGLSTWTDQLISQLAEKKFKIISIMPSREDLPEYKYQLPANVIEIQTIYLEDFMRLSPMAKKKALKLSKKEAQEIERFLSFDHDVDWQAALQILTETKKIGNSIEFLKSELIWTYLLKLYDQEFSTHEFNKFFWAMVSMYVPLINMIQQEGLKADIYHSLSTGYAGLMGLVFKLKYGQPLMLTEHGIYAREREEEIINAGWVEGPYKKMWIRFFYFISVGAYKHAEAVISLFRDYSSIQQELGADSGKTLVIPNGVEPASFRIRKHANEGVKIGAILRIVPIKDVKTLLRAFKIVHQQIPDAKLYIIGSGAENFDYYMECKHLVGLLHLDDKVIFTGQAKITEYLPLLDLLVLTSVSEGQPLVMLEGMAAGIPFVATDVGSCRELLEGLPEEGIGPAGIVVQPVSPEETAAAVIMLLKNTMLRADMGYNARRRVEKYYTQEMFIQSYRKVYDSVCAGKPAIMRQNLI